MQNKLENARKKETELNNINQGIGTNSPCVSRYLCKQTPLGQSETWSETDIQRPIDTDHLANILDISTVSCQKTKQHQIETIKNYLKLLELILTATTLDG